MVAQLRSTLGFGARLALGVMLLGLSATGAPTHAADDLAKACKTSLEQSRLWIRATDPQAPEDERAKVRAAVEKTNEICTAAREASPKDGEVLVDAACSLIQTLKSDHASARIQAALEFLPGGVGPESPKRARKVLKEMIDAGNGEAMVTYAMKVLGLQKAEAGSDAAKEGIALLERAAKEAKDGTALIYLSLLHNQGTMVERSEAKAKEYAQAAIDAGINRAYATMGQIHQNQGDYETAFKWFKQGAEVGDGFSQAMLGFLYSGGFGVDEDIDQAVAWWTKGRWNGDRLAASYLRVHREGLLAKAEWERKHAEDAKAKEKAPEDKAKKSE
jgi:TPR repeat protein